MSCIFLHILFYNLSFAPLSYHILMSARSHILQGPLVSEALLSVVFLIVSLMIEKTTDNKRDGNYCLILYLANRYCVFIFLAIRYP